MQPLNQQLPLRELEVNRMSIHRTNFINVSAEPLLSLLATVPKLKGVSAHRGSHPQTGVTGQHPSTDSCGFWGQPLSMQQFDPPD